MSGERVLPDAAVTPDEAIRRALRANRIAEETRTRMGWNLTALLAQRAWPLVPLAGDIEPTNLAVITGLVTP